MQPRKFFRGCFVLFKWMYKRREESEIYSASAPVSTSWTTVTLEVSEPSMAPV